MCLDRAATPRGLQRLHEDYILKVNAAVAAERWDLVSELADAFFADAQAEMALAYPTTGG